MKNLIFLLAFVLLIGCEKQKDNPVPNVVFYASGVGYKITIDGVFDTYGFAVNLRLISRSQTIPQCDSYYSNSSPYLVMYLKGGTYTVKLSTWREDATYIETITIYEDHCNIFDVSRAKTWH